MDELALIIECKKLKSFEEKIWLKHQLSFVSEIDRSDLIQNISEMNSGNLVAQQNEINILKLTYEEGKKIGLKDAFIAIKTIILYSLIS